MTTSARGAPSSATCRARSRPRRGNATASVTVVHVTAPLDVLQSRLKSRERDSDGDLGARIARSAEVERDLEVDMVIENVGPPDLGIRRLVSIIHAT